MVAAQAIISMDAPCQQAWQWGVSRLFSSFNAGVHPELNGGQMTKDSLLLIHVGKAGGSSVVDFLRATGIPFDQVHVHATPIAALDKHAHVLIPLRDPARRVESAIHELLKNHHLRPTNQSTVLLRCFNSPRAFINRLDDHSTRCGSVARGLIHQPPQLQPLLSLMARDQDRVPDDAPIVLARAHAAHMAMGACFYVGGLLHRLRTKTVWVTNMDTFTHDLHAAARGLLGAGFARSLGRTMLPNATLPNVGHANRHSALCHQGRCEKPLSTGELGRLRPHLAAEYFATEFIRRLAVNG